MSLTQPIQQYHSAKIWQQIILPEPEHDFHGLAHLLPEKKSAKE